MFFSGPTSKNCKDHGKFCYTQNQIRSNDVETAWRNKTCNISRKPAKGSFCASFVFATRLHIPGTWPTPVAAIASPNLSWSTSGAQVLPVGADKLGTIAGALAVPPWSSQFDFKTFQTFNASLAPLEVLGFIIEKSRTAVVTCDSFHRMKSLRCKTQPFVPVPIGSHRFPSVPIGSHRFPSVPIGSHRFPSVPIGSHRFPSVPIGSHRFPSVPIGSHRFPSVPIGSHRFPSVPIGSHRFPSVPIGSHRFPSVPIGSHRFPSVPIGSHRFPSVPIGSHRFPSVPIGSHRFPSVPIRSHPFPSVPIGSHRFPSACHLGEPQFLLLTERAQRPRRPVTTPRPFLREQDSASHLFKS